MDLALDDVQRDVLGAARTLLRRHAGPARARELGPTGHDDALLRELRTAGLLDLFAEPGGPLLAELVVEEATRSAARLELTANLLAGPALLGSCSVPVALAEEREPIVRYGGSARAVLVLDGSDRARRVTPRSVAVLEPAFGAPYDELDLSGGEALGPGSGPLLARWWRVGLAAEIGAAGETALALTVRHLVDRRQFGRPIASFQAVQHRLAELHVTTQEVTWLARRAAAGTDDDLAALAAGRACEAAQELSTELHQLSGAIGFTLDYDLHLWTLRLESLRHEMGGAESHYAAVPFGSDA